jgi:hypothetical protein
MRPVPADDGNENAAVSKAAKAEMIDAAERYVLYLVLTSNNLFYLVLKPLVAAIAQTLVFAPRRSRSRLFSKCFRALARTQLTILSTPFLVS